MEKAILAVGLLVFVGHLLVGLFKKTRIPDVLLLTLLGIVLGPYGISWVSVEQVGIVGSVFSTIALIVILFEGGVNMDLRAISSAINDSSRLTFATFIVTTGLTAVLTQPTLGWQGAWLLGLILGGTSSAVVIPMVSTLKIGDRTRVALSLESAITDVLCIVGVYALLESMVSGKELDAMKMTGLISSKLVMASILGVAGGIGWLVVLGKVRQIPNTQFTVFGLAFVLYGLSETLQYSGAIASLVFGITIANVKPHTFVNTPFLDRLLIAQVSTSERSLFGEAVFLVKILFFVYLGISLPFDRFDPFLIGGGIVASVYAARVLIVAFFLPGSCNKRDAMIAAVMIPKGLAAAVLATLPLQSGLVGGEYMRDVSFAVVFESILLTSILVPILDTPLIRALLENSVFRRFVGDAQTSILPTTRAETSLIDVFELTARMRAEADEKIADDAKKKLADEASAESAKNKNKSKDHSSSAKAVPRAPTVAPAEIEEPPEDPETDPATTTNQSDDALLGDEPPPPT